VVEIPGTCHTGLTEFRPGDHLVVRRNLDPSTGTIVLGIAGLPADLWIGEYIKPDGLIRPFNPAIGSAGSDGVEIVGVIEALLYRYYGGGLNR